MSAVTPATQPDGSQQAVVEAALVLLERMGLSPADRAGGRLVLGGGPDRRPRLNLAGAGHGAARLRRRPAPGNPRAAGCRHQPAQLPADQARNAGQPSHPRPGRDSGRSRRADRTSSDLDTGRCRGGQPRADRVHRLDAAPPRRPLRPGQ
jgi:hypothetical protein